MFLPFVDDRPSLIFLQWLIIVLKKGARTLEERDKLREKDLNHLSNKIVGQQIRSFRKQLKLTSDELAHRANIDRSYLSSIEQGKVTTSYFILVKIANALNLDIEDHQLLYSEVNPAINKFLRDKNLEDWQLALYPPSPIHH